MNSQLTHEYEVFTEVVLTQGNDKLRIQAKGQPDVFRRDIEHIIYNYLSDLSDLSTEVVGCTLTIIGTEEYAQGVPHCLNNEVIKRVQSALDTVSAVPEKALKIVLASTQEDTTPAISQLPKSTEMPHSHTADLQTLKRESEGTAEEGGSTVLSTPIPSISRRSLAPPAGGGGTSGSTEPMSPQTHQWKHLIFYDDQRAAKFATREEIYRAVDVLREDDNLRGVHWIPVGDNTIIVPAEALPYLTARGLKFADTKVRTDLSNEEVRRRQEKQRERRR